MILQIRQLSIVNYGSCLDHVGHDVEISDYVGDQIITNQMNEI